MRDDKESMMKKSIVFVIILTVGVMLPADPAKPAKKSSFGFFGGWSVGFNDNYRVDSMYDLYSGYDRADFFKKRAFSLVLAGFYQWKLSPRMNLQVEANYQKFTIKQAATYYQDGGVAADYPWSSSNDYYFSFLLNILYRFAGTGKVHYFIKAGLGPAFRHFRFFPSRSSIFWDNLGDYTQLHLQLGPEIHIPTNFRKTPTPLILGAIVHYLTRKETDYHTFGGGYISFYLGLGF